jgi:hypothetical protein
MVVGGCTMGRGVHKGRYMSGPSVTPRGSAWWSHDGHSRCRTNLGAHKHEHHVGRMDKGHHPALVQPLTQLLRATLERAMVPCHAFVIVKSYLLVSTDRGRGLPVMSS